MTTNIYSPKLLRKCEIMLKRKLKEKDGHIFYPVMKSRLHRETVELVIEHKFYPMWEVLEALGRVPKRPEGYKLLMTPSCGKRHCVNPDHMVWITLKEHKQQFNKKGLDHTLSKWDEKSLVTLKTLLGEGLSQRAIAKKMGIVQSTVSSACKTLLK